MKEDTSGDYIWIPFTHLKIEFNDAKSGWFQCSHTTSCLQSVIRSIGRSSNKMNK